MVTILYIGTHPEILETVVRLINSREGWTGIGVASTHKAIDVIASQKIDVVLLGCGLEKEVEDQLTATIGETNPQIKIVQHYGGGSGLLFGEILLALQ
jgi:DNA-binding NarL/FixJ family response regulator